MGSPSIRCWCPSVATPMQYTAIWSSSRCRWDPTSWKKTLLIKRNRKPNRAELNIHVILIFLHISKSTPCPISPSSSLPLFIRFTHFYCFLPIHLLISLSWVTFILSYTFFITLFLNLWGSRLIFSRIKFLWARPLGYLFHVFFLLFCNTASKYAKLSIKGHNDVFWTLIKV